MRGLTAIAGFVGIALACTTSGWAQVQEGAQAKIDPNVVKVVAGNNAFGFELYGKLREKPGNLFLSPYSISTALAMTYAGARGETEKQMAKVMHFEMGQDKLHAVFGTMSRRHNIIGQVAECSFETKDIVNVWVADKPDGNMTIRLGGEKGGDGGKEVSIDEFVRVLRQVKTPNTLVVIDGPEGLKMETVAKVLDAVIKAEVPSITWSGAKIPPAYELSLANALWMQKGYPFRSAFMELVKQNYGVELCNVDFAKGTEDARKTINAWVEKETKGKIGELFKPGALSRDTRMMLTSAVYMKARWQEEFPKYRTRDGDFTKMDGTRVKVPMMSQSHSFRYGENKHFQSLELPYKGSDLAMVVLLPKQRAGLPIVEKTLSATEVDKCLGEMNTIRVDATLPRFRIDVEFDLVQVLKDMGIKDAFSEKKADFSGMTEKGGLFITTAVHKAYVDVNEEGTEAAAATGGGLGGRVPRTAVFVADHPFFFMIRDTKTGSILFMGRVMDPRS